MVCCQNAVPSSKETTSVFFEMAMSLAVSRTMRMVAVATVASACHGDEGSCDDYGQNVLPALVMETGVVHLDVQNESVPEVTGSAVATA